jgi:dipeptidase
MINVFGRRVIDLRPAALVLVIGLVLFFRPLPAQEPVAGTEGQDFCTSIMVGRLASTDGSVMTSHTCDGNFRTWLNVVPGAKFAAGATTKIYSGKLHTETPTDLQGLVPRGDIPQVEETYAFLNTAYPCLNEHQLAIGETTIGGRPELENAEGKLYIEEVERLMLERCRTAREAIKLAGELVKQYGYGDSGECLTIADPKEVWQLEIFGAGPLEVGAVWAAARIPDDHIGVSANIPRISELDLKNPDRSLASDNVFRVAEEMGWWDPKSGEPFKFWKAYSGRKPFAIREFYIFSTLAPSLNLKLESEELPFTVKPDKKVSVRDVLRMFRETYAGTAYDLTKDLLVKARDSAQMIKSPVAHPWLSRDMIALLNMIKPGLLQPQRTIAIAGCSYATVIQCRSWLPDPLGGLCWFSFDNPACSARIPIFAGVLELPANFEACAQHRFRQDSACWAFRRANRLATVRWGLTQKMIEDTVREFEERALAELPDVEKRCLALLNSKTPDKEPFTGSQYLTKYTNDFARAAMQKYLELGDKFWGMFSRGF